MTRTTRFAARAAVLVSLVVALATLSLRPAHAAPCPAATPGVVLAQPLDLGVLQVARVAGESPGDPDRWEMRLDLWFCNPLVSDLTVDPVTIDHLNKNGGVIRSATVQPTDTFGNPTTIPANTASLLSFVRDDTQYPFPLPKWIAVTITFRNAANGFKVATVKPTYLLGEYRDAGPLKAYFFPARQSDLDPLSFWFQTRHTERNSYQRWAYDLEVERWDLGSSSWTKFRPDTTGAHKEDFLSFDTPVYAMSDGEIIGCNRGAPDNDPGVKNGNVPGGNVLWIRTGNETTLYAHLEQNTIPFPLCPHTDDKEYKAGDPFNDPPADKVFKVHVGDLLGRSGSSGNSEDEPHFHIHVFRGLPGVWGGSESGVDADARPLRFVNVKSELRTAGLAENFWRLIDNGAILPYQSRYRVNDCGIDVPFTSTKEIDNLSVEPSCYGQAWNAMVQRGERPTHVDYSEKISDGTARLVQSTVWRPGDGTPWVMLSDLTSAQLFSAANKWENQNSYKLLQLESYALNGNVRYAVIFVKQAGPSQHWFPQMDAATFGTWFGNESKAHFVAVNVSVAVVGGTPYYTALMEKANVGGYRALPGIPVADYQAVYDSEKAHGRFVAYLDAYTLGGTPYLSAIFYSKLTEPAAIHDVGQDDLRQLAFTKVAQHTYMRGLTAYMDGDTQFFAAFWRPAPQTTILSHPAVKTSSTSAKFMFTSTDPLGTFRCSREAGAAHPCNGSITYSPVPLGTHKFSVRARDREGIVDATPAKVTWTVVAPTLSFHPATFVCGQCLL